MNSPAGSYDGATLNQVVAVPGVGAQILRVIPMLQRVRLRQTSHAFCFSVDESLEDIRELFWADVADVASRTGGLLWLLSKCPNLRKLSLLSRTERDLDRDSWEQPRLAVLTCPQLANHSLLGLVQCRQLLCLQLPGCDEVDDNFLAMLAVSCHELESLLVNDCNITDIGVACLASFCPRLKELSVSYAQKVSDASIKRIAHRCQQLERLSIEKTAVTDSSVSAIAQHCVNLCHLDVGHCKKVSDAGLLMVARNCALLRSLSLRGASQGITDASIIAVAENCPVLQKLDVRSCYNLTDASIVKLVEHCKLLEHLDLPGYTTGITRVSMVEVVSKCPLLLHLGAPDFFDDDAMGLLAQNCPQLRALVAGVSRARVTGAGISTLAQHCPQLHRLELGGCGRITDAAMRLVGEHCRQLEELAIHTQRPTMLWANDGLKVVGCNCTQLRSFSIRMGQRTTDHALRIIVENCEQLERLCIRDARCSMTECAAAIGRNCTRLWSLHFIDCWMLTDGDVAAMLSGPAAAKLLKLCLLLSRDITDEAIMTVGRTCRQLRTLNLTYCDKVTNGSMMAIAQGCPRLTLLEVRNSKVTRDGLYSFDGRKCKIVV
eukprot:jgi/Mesvir1/14940/Mv26266-RA.1